MSGAQALFKALTEAGLDTCFANSGTSEGSEVIVLACGWWRVLAQPSEWILPRSRISLLLCLP